MNFFLLLYIKIIEMPANRNALIRYKTIDACLRNYYRKWTIDDLVEACADALYEYEGIQNGISKRTIQADIQLMRSDKLGYNAPIIVVEKKYYKYADKDYSITNLPLTTNDLSKLNDIIEILKQFHGFSHFKDLEEIVKKLEYKILNKQGSDLIVDFEKNPSLKGIEFLDKIYSAIKNKHLLEVSYRSFNAKKITEFKFCCYLLKEFNNRWFAVGRKLGEKQLLNLALDRIESINMLTGDFCSNVSFNPNAYYKNTVGVTVNEGSNVEKVNLRLNSNIAPYILTKPIHSSQKLVEENSEFMEIELEIIPNFELENIILSYGEKIKVLKPAKLREKIAKRINDMQRLY